MGNNPVNFVDPDGEFAILAAIAYGAAIGAAGSSAVYTAHTLSSGNRFSLSGLGSAALNGAIAGGVSGGLGHIGTSLGSFGQSMAFNSLNTATSSVAVSVSRGERVSGSLIAGSIAGNELPVTLSESRRDDTLQPRILSTNLEFLSGFRP